MQQMGELSDAGDGDEIEEQLVPPGMPFLGWLRAVVVSGRAARHGSMVRRGVRGRTVRVFIRLR
ncbi:hypothetical protein ACWEIM_15890 [Streptomyces sp. NPDC004778]